MKIFRFFIVYILVQSIFINSANAITVGGWSLNNGISQGAATVYEGTKTIVLNGKNVVKKGVAIVTPPAAAVSKVLARGLGGVALSVAVEQILGTVDWVLDPENNQIKYFKKTSTGDYSCQGFKGNSPRQACENWLIGIKQPTYIIGSCTTTSPTTFSCTHKRPEQTFFPYTITGTIVVTEDTQEAKLPLDIVSQKIQANAEGGDVQAQTVTKTAAADIVDGASKDEAKARPIVNQLEASAETATDETATGEATKPDTANPTAPPQVTNFKLEFPVFCGWAPIVCEAAQVAVNFPTTISDYWERATKSISETYTEVKEWAKSEKQENTELEIPEPETEDIDTEIAFSGECPADKEIPYNLGLGTINFKLSYSLICKPISDAKPILIFVGFFISALIIGGIKT